MKIFLFTTFTLLWIFCFSFNADAFSTRSQTVTYANFAHINFITISMSHVYFATTEGIIRYNKLENRWEDPLTGSEGIDHRDINRLWVDQFDEKLYIRSSTDLYEYDFLFNRWYPVTEIPNIDVEYIHVNPPQIMYAPVGFNFSAEGYIIDPYGRNFYFSDIVDDRSGNLWIGTWGLGSAIAGSSSHIIELLPYGLIQNRVNTIYNDSGILWVSGIADNNHRNGISMFDPDENIFSYIESGVQHDFPAIDINCIEGSNNYILIGSSQGLFILNRNTKKIEQTFTDRTGLPDDNVLSIKAIGDSIFVGTAGGLSLITSKGDSVRYLRSRQFFNTEIYDFERTDSTIWIASGVGAFQLHLGSGKLQKFQDPNLIIFSRTYAIERYENNLWFASDDGMVRLDLISGETQPFVSISRHLNGRALAVNNQIAALATDNGMTIYFLNDKKHPHEREFTTDDGLLSNNIYYLLMDGDYIWIGSDRGLTRFLWNDPDRID